MGLHVEPSSSCMVADRGKCIFLICNNFLLVFQRCWIWICLASPWLVLTFVVSMMTLRSNCVKDGSSWEHSIHSPEITMTLEKRWRKLRLNISSWKKKKKGYFPLQVYFVHNICKSNILFCMLYRWFIMTIDTVKVNVFVVVFFACCTDNLWWPL